MAYSGPFQNILQLKLHHPHNSNYRWSDSKRQCHNSGFSFNFIGNLLEVNGLNAYAVIKLIVRVNLGKS